ncbi:MAG TPA: hypothetical protein VM659_04550 [Dongiaceae bacterium]|nr:hypothetical protein [Dongiaceae bacterium]
MLRAQQATGSILSRFLPARIVGLSSAFFPFLLLAAPVIAVPTAPTIGAPGAANASMQPHAGYPTTREKWRYCPRDGSHQCVELDIPGVTVPDQAAAPADPAKPAQ